MVLVAEVGRNFLPRRSRSRVRDDIQALQPVRKGRVAFVLQPVRPRRMRRLGEVPQVLTDLEEVQNHRVEPAEVPPQELLQARAAVADDDPPLGTAQGHPARL